MTNTLIKIAQLFIVPLVIAPLSKADYDAWLKLWQNYLTFYETRLPPSTTEKTWHNLLESDVPIYGFGA